MQFLRCVPTTNGHLYQLLHLFSLALFSFVCLRAFLHLFDSLSADLVKHIPSSPSLSERQQTRKVMKQHSAWRSSDCPEKWSLFLQLWCRRQDVNFGSVNGCHNTFNLTDRGVQELFTVLEHKPPTSDPNTTRFLGVGGKTPIFQVSCESPGSVISLTWARAAPLYLYAGLIACMSVDSTRMILLLSACPSLTCGVSGGAYDAAVLATPNRGKLFETLSQATLSTRLL